jgi:hypothetical protein
MAKSHLKLVTPTAKKRTVAPRRRPNGDLRTREYLTEAEVERLIKAATANRETLAFFVLRNFYRRGSLIPAKNF